MSYLKTERIISEGQTGIYREALHVALEWGIPCGQWYPKGRNADDGVIPDLYPLTGRIERKEEYLQLSF